MKMFKRASHPLFVEDQDYDWGKKSHPLRKLFFTTLLTLGVVAFLMFILPQV